MTLTKKTFFHDPSRHLNVDEMRASARYTKRVATLKKLLPLCAGLLLLGLFLWPRAVILLEAPDVGPKIDPLIAVHNRIDNPRMLSVDQEGRPYALSAKSIDHALTEKARMVEPSGELELDHGLKLKVKAHEGQFFEKENRVDYEKGVTVETNSGYALKTDHAHVNLRTKEADGTAEVQGSGPAGTVQAQGFHVDQGGNRIHFKGKSTLVLQPHS